MQFSYDYYKNLKQPKMFLANPNKSYIGIISEASDTKLTLKFNNLNELTFNIYENINNEQTVFYDKLEVKRLVELQYIGWFQINKVEKKYDDSTEETYKVITCLSLENELINRTIYDINGVFSLYDSSYPDKSLLHIISAECGWSVGSIDPDLLLKYRTFSLDTAKIYNFMMTDLSKSFECVFTFDTYTRTINCHKLSSVGSLTDIVVSRKNILQNFTQQCDGDKIVTKLKIVGGDDSLGGNVDVRSVNFGLDYILNLDYYMSSEWGVSQSTIDAWNIYKTKKSDVSSIYNTLLSTLKTKQSELLVLQNELVNLNSLKLAQEGVRDSSLSLHGGAPSSTDSDYTSYQNAITLINTYSSQITNKNSQIVSKKAEITTIQNSLDNVDLDVSISNNFTPTQVAEINQFIMDGDSYEDSTFIITDQMSQSEIIDMKLELKSYAETELARASQPQYVVKISSSNLFTLQDNKDELISYQDWISNFSVGNLISIKFRDDYFTTARLMEMTIDFDNLDSLDLVFSDKSRLDDELVQLAEVIANAGRTSATLNLSKYGYDSASLINNDVRAFINGVLNATNNKIVNNDNQELTIDTYGQLMRKWLPDQNKYSDGQSRWCNQNLLFTSDSWKSTSLAVGLLTLPDGSTDYGIAARVIYGEFILGGKLNITNSSGTYLIDNNGFTASATVGLNNYSVGINPSTPSDIINVKVNGVKKFYIDTTTNELMFNGKLTANAINADMINALDIVATSVKSSWVYSGNISGDNIYGGTIQGVTFMSKSLNNVQNTKIEGGIIVTNALQCDGGTAGSLNITGNYIQMWHPSLSETFSVNGTGDLKCRTLNNATPITSSNLQTQFTSLGITVSNATNAVIAQYASDSGHASSADNLKNVVYVSINNNFRPYGSNTSCGTSDGLWSSVWASTGSIQTSDIRKKNSIENLDSRYIQLFDNLNVKRFKMNNGTSDRYHLGFIAQEVEDCLTTTNITSKEFAGFVKDPIYSSVLDNGDYDIESDIVDYNYFLRYDEFIPLLVLKIKELESKIVELSEKG